MSRILLTALLMLLPTMTMAQTADPDHCGATGFQGLVGQSGEIAVMLVLDQPKRVITPGSIVTRDYRLDRINFDVNDENQITRVYCG